MPLLPSKKIRLVDPDDPSTDANPEPAGRGLELYPPRHSSHRPVDGERVILFAEDPTVTRAAILVENRSVCGRGLHLFAASIKLCFTTWVNTIAAHVPAETMLQPRPAPFP